MTLHLGLLSTLSLHLRASLERDRKGQEKGIALMGSEGSTEAELDSKKSGVDPRGSDSCEAYRLGRGRVGYTRVCKCRCRCMCKCWLLLANADDPAINQALNGIPKSEAVVRRVPGGPMETTELIRIMPPRRGIW